MRVQLMKTSLKQQLTTLSAIATSLTALPSHAAVPQNNTTIEVGYSNYIEDDLPEEKVLFGSTSRYDIDVSEFKLVAPIGDSNQLNVEYSVDSMSGASPWYVMDLGDGPILAMSGATIVDERKDVLIGWTHYLPDDTLSIAIGNSSEDDYKANNIGLSWQHELNNDNTILSVNHAVSMDDINASDSDLFVTRPTGMKKRVANTGIGITQVISSVATMQAGIGYESAKGYLSDPYKLASVDGFIVQENRPETKYANILTAGYRHYFIEAEGALQADARWYQDSWGIKSSTIELGWHQSIGSTFSLRPSVRYYRQSAADFFANTSTAGSKYYSSDSRLSNFKGRSYGLVVSKAILGFVFDLGYEKYSSSSDTKDENVMPLGLVDFSLTTLSVKFEFE